MRTIILLLTILTIGAAEVQLPSSVQRSLDRHEKALAKAQAEFDAAKADAAADLSEDLEKEVERATKRGDLELALAIKNTLAGLTGGEVIEGAVDLVATTPAPRGKTVTADEAQLLIAAMPKLDARAWDRLGGIDMEIPTTGRETTFAVRKGEQYLMIPNPDDRWCNDLWDWTGEAGIGDYLSTGVNRRALVWFVGEIRRGSQLIDVSADAKCIRFQVNTWTVTDTGSIRVKLFKVQ
jgi:hypothetical protein